MPEVGHGKSMEDIIVSKNNILSKYTGSIPVRAIKNQMRRVL
jgi:hypothetical protein